MFASLTAFLADDPMLRASQAVLLLGVSFIVFLIFWTLRDSSLRMTSPVTQVASLLLVTLLPIVGFLIYLLVRPARTLKEREMEALLRTLVEA